MTARTIYNGGSPFTNGELRLSANDINDTIGSVAAQSITWAAIDTLRQLKDRVISFSKGALEGFGDSYIDSTGRLDSVDTTSTSAQFVSDYYKPYYFPTGTAPYVIIEATSLSPSNFAINDCLCSEVAPNTWVIFAGSGSDAVKQAKIYKTLFYGTDGTDARAKTSYITGITAIKTSDTRHVGKRGYYMSQTITGPSYRIGYIGTFENTTTNGSVQGWSIVSNDGSTGTKASVYCLPSGGDNADASPYIRNITTGGASASSDETESDTTGDIINNPANIQLYGYVSSSGGRNTTQKVFFITSGSVTFAQTVYYDGGAISTNTVGSVDFKTMHNVPEFILAPPLSSSPFIIIEATSLNTGSFNINNCTLNNIDTGKWILQCGSGDNETRRAQIYKTLFYGTSGTNPAALAITGLTALKTSIPRDVGNRAYFRHIRGETDATAQAVSATGSFTSLTGNTDVSLWSLSAGTPPSAGGGAVAVSVTLNPGGSGTGVSWTFGEGMTTKSVDELGSNTFTDELTNPVGVVLSINGVSGDRNIIGSAQALVLTKSPITWTLTGSGYGVYLNNTIDFTTTYSIPLLTDGTDDASSFQSFITHTLPLGSFQAGYKAAIGVPHIRSWNSVAQIDYKIQSSLGEDTGWLPCGSSPIFSRFTQHLGSASKLLVRLGPSLNNTGSDPSIYGFYVYMW